MSLDQFNERLEEIRVRFKSKLGSKLDGIETSLPLLSSEGNDGVEAMRTAYRLCHEIVGAGRTLGFTMLGQAARDAEAILIEPYRMGRALNVQEVTMLTQAQGALRAAARIEAQPTDSAAEPSS